MAKHDATAAAWRRLAGMFERRGGGVLHVRHVRFRWPAELGPDLPAEVRQYSLPAPARRVGEHFVTGRGGRGHASDAAAVQAGWDAFGALAAQAGALLAAQGDPVYRWADALYEHGSPHVESIGERGCELLSMADVFAASALLCEHLAAEAEKAVKKGEGKRPAHRPRIYDPKKDAKLVRDWKASGMQRTEFEKERGEELGEVTRAQDRLRASARRERETRGE